MIDHDTDEARVLRRRRLIEVRPSAAKDMLREFDYLREYEQPYVITTDNVEAIEATHKCLFCPACRQDMGALTKARKLHVSYGLDPLNNYPMIASVRCSCGWNEMIPAIKEEASAEDKHDAHESADAARQIAKQAALGASYGVQQMYGMTASQMQAKQNYAHQRYTAEMSQMIGANPSHQGIIDKIPFGQGLADKFWKDLDTTKEIREAAEQYRRSKEHTQQMQAYRANMGEGMNIAIDEKIRYAKEILDKQNMPTEVAKLDKGWYRTFANGHFKK